MRSAAIAAALLLTFAAACSGDYGRTTSPYGTPPNNPPYPTDTPPPTPARPFVSLAITAPESVLVAGDSIQLAVFGLDAQGQQVARVQFPTLSVDNGFSFLLNA